MVHKIPFACSLACLLLALSVVKIHAQVPAPRSYLFADIKDTSGQPVTDASLAVYGADGKQITTGVTNEAKIRVTFPIRSDHHYSVLVSKQGFQPSEHVFFARPSSLGTTLVEQMPFSYTGESSSIVLHKTPANVSERKAFDARELQTQLILAAKRGDPLRITKLLQLGVDPDTVDTDGVPALVWAVFAGDTDTINILLERGAHVRTKHPLGPKALLLYLAEGLVRQKQSGTSNADDMGDRYKRQTTVVQLLRAGADVNAKDSYLGTTLNAALRAVPNSLFVSMIDDLIKAGANVNTPDEERLATPLMWAAQSGSVDSVKMLLAAGASIDVKDQHGRTALMWAQVPRSSSGQSHTELTDTLIKAGANVNARDENGITPLILAAQFDLIEQVKTLLAARAEINARDKWGNTALIAAFDSYYYCESYKDSSRHPAPLLVRTLLDAGADIHAVNFDGKPPLLMLAARTNSWEALKLLLDAGAPINGRDKEGRTALMHASYYPGFKPEDQVQTVKALNEAGADVSIKDNSGHTALEFAQTYSRNPAVIELLKSKQPN